MSEKHKFHVEMKLHSLWFYDLGVSSDLDISSTFQITKDMVDCSKTVKQRIDSSTEHEKQNLVSASNTTTVKSCSKTPVTSIETILPKRHSAPADVQFDLGN